MLITILSLICGTIGSIILAFSLNQLHKTYNAAFKIFEASLTTIANYLSRQGSAFVPINIADYIKNNKKGSDTWTIVGVVFIIIGLLLGLGSLFTC
ncbi:MAG: hypothetical protein PHO32_07245 [Candidatus Cloacimonetes bacterium]|nr:hypothetical protein [Candidatus Cloacimonadota bacterium]